jgi:hypothetical protein
VEGQAQNALTEQLVHDIEQQLYNGTTREAISMVRIFVKVLLLLHLFEMLMWHA